MSSINVSDSDKEWFDEFKDGRSQPEAFAEMVQVVRTFEGEPVDHEELAEKLSATLIAQQEIAAYRGAKEAIEKSELDP